MRLEKDQQDMDKGDQYELELAALRRSTPSANGIRLVLALQEHFKRRLRVKLDEQNLEID